MNSLRNRIIPIGIVVCLTLLTHTFRPAVAADRAPDSPIRIALVSDTHVQQSTNAEPKMYLARLEKTIEAVNAAKVELVLLGGDLTEHGTAAELRDFRQRIKGFAAPTWMVPGNHDIGNKIIPGKTNKDSVTLRRVETFERECGPSSWVRQEAGVRVIGLNSALLGSQWPQETKVWDLLASELVKPGSVPTLLLLHHPPFLKKADEAGGDYFNMEPEPRGRLLAVAKQGGVRAILSGHLHYGLTNRVNGLLLLTTPPISFGLPKGKQPEGWMLITVSKDSVEGEFQPLPKAAAPATKPEAKTSAQTK
jgi:3',5'-cyclic-AMP phosphodiesterase